MKLLGETNCLVYENFTKEEVEAFFNFARGLGFWDEDESVVCVDTKKISRLSLEKEFLDFFKTDVTKAQFLILKFGDFEDFVWET